MNRVAALATDSRNTGMTALDPVDRRIVLATQAGLPLSARPWHTLAEYLGIDAGLLMSRVQALQAAGVIRRIAAVPNHYALGYRANGMTVWNVPDESVDELGRQVGALEFVSHCYRRPRHMPLWPYNLFAMVHGRTRDDVGERVRRIESMLDGFSRGHEVLYSRRILKKSGLRIRG